MKLFIAESGSDQMIEMVERTEDSAKLSSVLSTIEVRSGIRRRQYAGEIERDLAEAAIADLEIEARRMVQLPITAAVVEQATVLIDRWRLRALDAIQLATSITARENQGTTVDVTFVCTDRKLIDAAEGEGFLVWNPTA